MNESVIFWVFVIFINGIVYGSFSAYLAIQKQRDAGSWSLLGFIFGEVALLAIVGLPPIKEKNISKNENSVRLPDSIV